MILQILLPSFWTRGLSRYYRLKCGHEDPIVASKCIAQQIGQQNERRPRRPWDAMGPTGWPPYFWHGNLETPDHEKNIEKQKLFHLATLFCFSRTNCPNM